MVEKAGTTESELDNFFSITDVNPWHPWTSQPQGVYSLATEGQPAPTGGFRITNMSPSGDRISIVRGDTMEPEQEVHGPEIPTIEIGAFGKIEHREWERRLEDAWLEDGAPMFRDVPLPDGPFRITSGGLPVYSWDGFVGTWFGSEHVRRQRETEERRCPGPAKKCRACGK